MLPEGVLMSFRVSGSLLVQPFDEFPPFWPLGFGTYAGGAGIPPAKYTGFRVDGTGTPKCPLYIGLHINHIKPPSWG